MRLLAISVRNLRAYGDRVELKLNDFTALIGRNDVGKSTLLEALNIFFNTDAKGIDQDDPCKATQSKVIEISCTFDDLPAELTIDARAPTTLASEHLLNGHGLLELVKQFDCTTKTPKLQIFARAIHPTAENVADLLKLKNAELKARAAQIGAALNNVDERSNVQLRTAIRVAVENLQSAETLVPLDSDEGKKVWAQLEPLLPLFALFQADRPSKEDDPEVADPMKFAVAQAVASVQAELENIKERVKESVMDVANRTLAKLREMDPNLAQELNPEFKAEPKWEGFKLSLSGDEGIPINKRGSGARRLILLSFFRAEAERRRLAAERRGVIYAIEEPESSQHPNNQIMLIKTLLSLSDDPSTQVIITTHVPGIASLIPIEDVRFVVRDDDGATRIEQGGDEIYGRVAETLGVTPDKRAQVAIFVEGPNDVTFLLAVSRLHRGVDQTLLDLESDHRLAFVPTGGGTLKQWVDKRYLQNAGLVEVHVYDCDDQNAPPYQAQVDEVNNRDGADVAFLTSKREMENYIHAAAIQVEYGLQVNVTDWNDVPKLVAEAAHAASNPTTPWAQLDGEKRSSKTSRAKRRLSEQVVPSMTLAQLQERDAAGDVLEWLRAIRDRVH